MDNETWYKLRKKEINLNDQDLFFSILIKGFVCDLNQQITIRGEKVDHFFLNTGDDIMYLERKGVDQSKEPLQQTNEDFVYNKIPRCMLTPAGVNILTDQLTNPYTRGVFQYENDDEVITLNAEYRRLPIEMNIDLRYYFNSFTDVLECTQLLCAKLAFINNFKIVYLGQTIPSTYRLSDSIENEISMEFDGITTDSKYRSINISLTLNSNIPIIHSRTIEPTDRVIIDPRSHIIAR